MIRKSDLIWLGIAAVAGSTLFHTSYQVQDKRERLAQVQQSIARERTAISVLNAEWSYLNGPERLEQQAAAHLKLKPLTAQQVAGLEAVRALPPRPAAPAPQVIPASLTQPSGHQTATAAFRPVGRSPMAAPPVRQPDAPLPVMGQRSMPTPAPTSATASVPASGDVGASAPAAAPVRVAAVQAGTPASASASASATARAARRSVRAAPVSGFATVAAARPAAAPAYIPATDEIGQLLARLGRAR